MDAELYKICEYEKIKMERIAWHTDMMHVGGPFCVLLEVLYEVPADEKCMDEKVIRWKMHEILQRQKNKRM